MPLLVELRVWCGHVDVTASASLMAAVTGTILGVKVED